jgi:peptide/nickel transport system substrate-binding protein
MKKLRWPLLIVVLALAAITVLLISQQDPLPPVEAEEVQPVTGGIYTEALVGSFSRFNPLLDIYNPPDHDVGRLIFSRMIRFDHRGLPYGDLVDSWGISQDGRTYTFAIKENAYWHDGEAVKSDDIIFTIEIMRHPDSIIQADVKDLWEKIEIVRLDQKTIQFRLPEPFAPFLDYLTFGILPVHVLEGVAPLEMVASPFNLQPIGSGPYRFDTLLMEDERIAGVVLAIHEDYHGEKPFIEKFAFRYYPSSEEALEAYRRGEVMGISRISVNALEGALEEPRLNLYTGRLPELSMIFFNLDNTEVEFLSDPAVRRALLLGLNRQWMVDNLLKSQAIVAHGPIFPGAWAYYDGVEQIEYDPEAAIEILREAGYSMLAEGEGVRKKEGGSLLRFDLIHPDTDIHRTLAEAIQKDWQRLGVEARPVAIPYEQLVSDFLDTRLYHAALIDLNLSRSPDPDPYPFWHEAQAASGQNYGGWGDRQASGYLEQARILIDKGERAAYYRNFQIRFSQELPALPLFYPVYTYAVDAEVQGVRMGPLYDPSDRLAGANSWYLMARLGTSEITGELITPVPDDDPEETGD